MPKIDTSTIAGYAEMTAEQKLAALESFEYDDGSKQNEKLKAAMDKAASEAASYKKKLNDVSQMVEKAYAPVLEVLTDAGIEFLMPKGAFYFFPKSPVADERVFVEKLLQERVLAVPGRGFGLAGHFRLTFCVDESIIANSAESFKNAMKKL